MTLGQFFAFAALAAKRWRMERAASFAQMAMAFRADGPFVEKVIKALSTE
jgi:hypothetical protein